MAFLPISDVETFLCIKGYDMGSIKKAAKNFVKGVVGIPTSVVKGDVPGLVGNWERIASFGTWDPTGEGEGAFVNDKTFKSQQSITDELNKLGDSSAANMLEYEKKTTRKQRANLFSTSGGAMGEQVGYTGSQNRASLFGN